MYAITHTTLNLISLSDAATRKVEACKAKCKKKMPSGVFYRTVIKNEVVSFFLSYDEAKSFQILMHLDGSAA